MISGARRITYRTGLSALSCLFVKVVHAQVPSVAAEAAVVASTAGSSAVEAQTPQQSQPDARADRAGSDEYLQRHRPRANTFELGAFIGPLFISDQNSFRAGTRSNPGAPLAVRPLTTFRQPSVELGLRGGYMPLPFLGAELEGMVALAETDAGSGATVLAARAHVLAQLPYWSIVPFAVAGAGYWGVLNRTSGNDSDPAFHFGGGVKAAVTDRVAVRVDVRDSITNQHANRSYPHNVEALAGATLVFGGASSPQDRDRDGVVDAQDQCPLEAGPLPSGCPVRDRDSDGISDAEDQCVIEPGIAPTGCPIRDVDQDGVVDADDQCIDAKGSAPTGCPDSDLDGFLDRVDQCRTVPGVAPDGCPVAVDADGDGLIGDVDRCPDRPETVNGFEDADGCPDELPAEVTKFVGVIAGVEFDTNLAVLRPSSDVALEKAASVLLQYPSVRLEIIGHTDDRGSRERNLDLSRQRADSVKANLVARGIESSRIETRGQGPDAPLAPNATAAGRQRNRRIEFRVLQ